MTDSRWADEQTDARTSEKKFELLSYPARSRCDKNNILLKEKNKQDNNFCLSYNMF